MAISRIRISKAASEALRSMERKTKLTPNVLARLAIGLSLADKRPLNAAVTDSAGLEFNYSTLYGELEQLFRHLALEWAGQTDIDIDKALRLHLERGTPELFSFLATHDVLDLCAPASKTA